MVWRPPTFTEEATAAFAGMAVVSGIEFAVLKAVGQLTEQARPWKLFCAQGCLALGTFYHLSTTYSQPIKHDSEGTGCPNPFANATWRPTLIQRVKMSFIAATVLPVRVVTLATTFLTTVLLSKVVVAGLTEEQIAKEPLNGWRLALRAPMPLLSRLMLFFGFGVVVREKGHCPLRA